MKDYKRLVVGNTIKCKATLIRHSTWCSGVYGRDYRDVYVYGIVLSTPTERKSEVGPRQTYVIADFHFHNGDRKAKRLHLSIIKTLAIGEVAMDRITIVGKENYSCLM
jgi:hypothetical protein